VHNGLQLGTKGSDLLLNFGTPSISLEPIEDRNLKLGEQIEHDEYYSKNAKIGGKGDVP